MRQDSSMGRKDVPAPVTLSKDPDETALRYAAYASRVKNLMSATSRYVAYSSEIGEAFRPVAHPHLVRTAYAISWTYIFFDVYYTGLAAQRRLLFPPLKDKNEMTLNDDRQTPVSINTYTFQRHYLSRDQCIHIANAMCKQFVFQLLASMAAPAFAVYSTVRISSHLMKNHSSNLIRNWLPTAFGISVIPILPAIFDGPIHRAVEYAWKKGEENLLGYESNTVKRE